MEEAMGEGGGECGAYVFQVILILSCLGYGNTRKY